MGARQTRFDRRKFGEGDEEGTLLLLTSLGAGEDGNEAPSETEEVAPSDTDGGLVNVGGTGSKEEGRSELGTETGTGTEAVGALRRWNILLSSESISEDEGTGTLLVLVVTPGDTVGKISL